jgi:hypothetical protein
MKCINCSVDIRSGARYCKEIECNRARCREYYANNRLIQIVRKTKNYFQQKEKDYESLRNINRKAVEKKRFGERREIILKRGGNICANCGSSKNLVIHHKDHNGRNNDSPNNESNNLVVVCSPCHARHHFGHAQLKI